MRRAVALLVLGLALLASRAGAEDAGDAGAFEALFDVRLVAVEGTARVKIVLGPVEGKLDWIRLRVDPQRQFGFQGDGTIEAMDDTVKWTPPRQGGHLEYTVRIDHLRDARAYDARCAKSWAIFRGDDLVPQARVDYEPGARSRSRLRLRLPEGWSVATPYAKNADGSFAVGSRGFVFARPVGWIVAGHLGVVREKVAGASLAIAGPRGQHLRRLDLLAFLRWTLPDLLSVTGKLPERILVVGAGDPMWRGGLSGASSLFLHADRPLISSDTTSPLLHELMHVAMRANAGPDGDWVVEGIAEYYSIELLARSRAIGRKRFERALERIEAHGKRAPRLLGPHADAAMTARAVGVMRAVDAEIRSATDNGRNLDAVVKDLVASPAPVTTARFVSLASRAAGRDLGPLVRRLVGEDWEAR